MQLILALNREEVAKVRESLLDFITELNYIIKDEQNAGDIRGMVEHYTEKRNAAAEALEILK